MAVPTVLTQESDGAPALTGETGSGYNWIKWIAAEAGWTVAFDDPTGYRVALRSNPVTGSGMYYLFLDDPADHGGDARSMAVKSYSQMTDIDTGQDEYPASGEVYIHKSVTQDTTVRPFRAIATDRHLYLAVSGRSDTDDAWLFYLGDFSSFAPGDTRAAMLVLSNTIDFGSLTSRIGAVSEVSGRSIETTGLIAQNKAQDQLGVNCALFISRPSFNSGEIGSTGPRIDPITEAVNTSRVAVYENGESALRGLLPGILAPGDMTSGGQSEFTAGDVLPNINNGNEPVDCLLVQSNYSPTSPVLSRLGSALFDISTDWDDW